MTADPRRGMVLVVVLWSIALLSALAMAAATTFRGFTGVMGVSHDRVQVDGLLTAGLEAAAGVIAAQGDAPFESIETAISLSAGSVSVALSDEGGRIDIGRAPVEVLAALLRTVGVPDTQADGLAGEIDAWRKPADQQGGTSAAARLSAPAPSGAVQTGNAQAGNAQGANAQPPANDQPFTDVRQLANVPGMAREWIAAIVPLTTVFGDEKINPLTAPAPVLAALPGVGSGRLDAFLAARRSPPPDTERLLAMLGPAQKYLAVKPRQATSARISAWLPDGYTAAAQAVIVLLSQDRQPYRVLSWNPLPSAPGDGS